MRMSKVGESSTTRTEIKCCARCEGRTALRRDRRPAGVGALIGLNEMRRCAGDVFVPRCIAEIVFTH